MLNMCAVSSQIVDCSYFICDMCVYIFHMSLSNIWPVWHIYLIWWIYFFWQIFGQNHEVCIAGGCILAHICKNVGFICPFSKLAV